MAGKEVEVKLTDGTSISVTVRQIPVSEYEKAFSHHEDEIEMVALACGKVRNWVLTLQPESYEQLVEAVGSVNQNGFFAYARRRSVRQEELLARRMNSIKPEVLASAVAKASPPFVPGLQPK